MKIKLLQNILQMTIKKRYLCLNMIIKYAIIKNKNEYMLGLDESMHVALQNGWGWGCGCCGCLIFLFAFLYSCVVGLLCLIL